MYQYDSVGSGGEKNDLDALVSRVESSLKESLLPVEVFNDDKVFRAEMERIFTNTWVFLGHETEIPKAGDYVLRRLGLDQVIVIRDTDGKTINVLLNHCRHRGTEVCHEDKGNTKSFKCPYHGWTYKINGDFAGAPHFRDAYEGVDAKQWGLHKAAKVDSYQGLIFASISGDVVDLQEHLGEAKWALDAIFGLHPQGMRVVATPERFRVRADWKSGAENFCGDAYHVSTAHLAAELSGFIPAVREVSTIARGLEFDDGNSFICHNITAWGEGFQFWAYPPEIREQFDLSGLDEVQIDMIKNTPPTIGTIFPNMSYLRFPQPAKPGKFPVPFTNIRQWQPVAPGVMELWTWELEYAFVPEDKTHEHYVAGQFGFGAGGVFEMDDTSVWEGVAKAANSPWNRATETTFHYQQRKAEPDPEWKGKGRYYKTIYGKYMQQGFWRRWLKDMARYEKTNKGGDK